MFIQLVTLHCSSVRAADGCGIPFSRYSWIASAGMLSFVWWISSGWSITLSLANAASPAMMTARLTHPLWVARMP